VFTFIESSIFERVLHAYLDDDEYSELQQYLIYNPEAGEVVPGSGGCARFAGRGREWESEAGSVLSILFGIDPTSFGC
jgi:hypothetical protein